MRKKEIAKIQHYVPQFILKNFSFGKKPQIWAFDKKNGKKFKTHIKNVASENGFYDFSFENTELTIEPSLSNIEAKASGIIDGIIATKSIINLNDEDRAILSCFFALQFTRTKQHRIMFKDMNDDLAEAIKSRGWDPNKINGYKKFVEEDVKLHGIKSMVRSVEYMPYFFKKSWLLFETSEAQPLYISDNPITLQNARQFGPYGNIGLAVKGIEIYFPLSKTLSLGMYCLSIEKEFRESYEKYKLVYKIDPVAAARIVKDPLMMDQIMATFESKMTM